MARRGVSSQGVQDLHAELARIGFQGDFEAGLGARSVASTDNSIYEVMPSAIVYPREQDDIARIVKAARGVTVSTVTLTARGGNTGTNGQSLAEGVVIDFARHMNRIIEIDAEAGRVRVEPGVVLDQLNAELARHGLFFPPMVSTASRATIGGMVATDASGKGSRIYGKTSDYIENIDVVLADGMECRVQPVSVAEAEQLAAGDSTLARAYREVLRVCREKADVIADVFPDMNRGLTGYNLQKAYDAERQQVSLAYLLAGSEGTLALTRALTLRVIPKPKRKALMVVRYDDFDRALRDVEVFLEADPVAVEILDDKVLGVAQTDIIWTGIEAVLGAQATRPVNALLFVEFAADEQDDLDAGLARLEALRGRLSASLVDMTAVRDAGVIAKLWELREKSVGLLARLGSGRQGMPFVEDTAVPPQHLADYVQGFRAILDGHGLQYGMFGHADVGCLHVRPFLDMKAPEQAALIRPVSDAVAALTKTYGGLLWGEHGRGVRGEYSPFFFGPELYPDLAAIKAAFDPENRLNPGKLAAPDGAAVSRIDEVPFRGTLDSVIGRELAAEFDRATACNGNGACFSWDALDVMCPSYKASRDRAQSPKGRAALLRVWARSESSGDVPAEDAAEIEGAVAQSLATCLSCKSCTTMCPVKVDIPAMKSRFLARYYEKHGRPAAHRLLARVEDLFAMGRRLPGLANAVIGMGPVRRLIERSLGFVDLPAFSPQRAAAEIATFDARRLAARTRAKTVVLVEDTFTSSFDSGVLLAAARFLERLGYTVFRLPAQANGKVLHLTGQRDQFARLAQRRVSQCAAIVGEGVRLVGLDAATSLMFEQEYREFVTDEQISVTGLEELLANDLDAGLIAMPRGAASDTVYSLLGHCTETALRPRALDRWAQVFAAAGVSAKPVRTGCCGMAGLFGHELRNQEMSRRLYDMTWAPAVEDPERVPLATGYSCRSQVKRFAGQRPQHPIELLWSHISSE